MIEPQINLAGQVALVTGGGRGIGRAIALALAQNAAKVALVARSRDQLAAVAGEISARGGRAMGIPADVTDWFAIQAAISEIEQTLGSIDLLVNNAGVGIPVGALADCDPQEWWRCIEVNLRGPLLCSRAVLPGMLPRRRGRIVNIVSGTGTRAIPYASAYVTSKTALIRMTEILAAELRDAGVHVFALHPGTVRTEMAERVLALDQARRLLPQFVEVFDNGRDLPPERAAEAVVKLASGRADALAGRLLAVEWNIDELIGRAPRLHDTDALTLRLIPAPD
jgi:NAD(P)-dependent dehydrogenase (short-subunit alcohol dehydrogenase family)